MTVVTFFVFALTDLLAGFQRSFVDISVPVSQRAGKALY
jgi:hypothetical protein